MAKVIFTPWKEHSQLLDVRSQLYPPPGYDGPDMRPIACARVRTALPFLLRGDGIVDCEEKKVASWKLRGNLPHAVEATALLTDAILHDDAAKNSIFSIRATYSAAFCRYDLRAVISPWHWLLTDTAS